MKSSYVVLGLSVYVVSWWFFFLNLDGKGVVDLPSLPSPLSRLEYWLKQSQLTINLIKFSISPTCHLPP